MKYFSIKPLMNLAAKSLPKEVEITVPAGCTFRVEQYFNYVWLMVEQTQNMKTQVTRHALIVTEGESIPDDYVYAGCVIGNLIGDASLLEKDESDEEDEEEEENLVTESPETEEEFYASFFPLSVYISPEKLTRLDTKSWSYLGEKS